MASSGAMADFGQMPTSRKVLVFVVIGGLLGLLYYRFAYKKLVTDYKRVQAIHAGNAQTSKDLADQLPKFKQLRADKEELDKRILAQQKALPTESEVPAFFETLERKITEAGVEVLKWSKRPEEPVENFVKVPLDVELTGTFLQIKRFFASLIEPRNTAERERIVSIENLSLTNPTIRNREIILTAKFTAVTYRQADASAGAGNAPSVPGGVAPVTPVAPNADAPPPMPSAGTPAGARTRTEDAIDKGRERTDKGIERADGSGSDRLKGGL